MGGQSDTQKTFDQVQDELLLKLYLNARTLLEPGTGGIIPPKPTFTDLFNISELVGLQRFKAKYGYEYKGQQTQPIPPPADGQAPWATSSIASYESVNEDIITKYVNDRILSGVALDWPRKSAEADLQALGNRLFTQSTNQNWVVQDFQKVYQNQDSINDEFECQTDAILVFTNSRLIIDGRDVKIVVLVYVGVWYHVTSRLNAARNHLLNILLTNARSLQPTGDATTGTETQQLEIILRPYAPSRFRAQFNYDFNTNATKPPDLIAGSDPYLRGSQIFAIPSSIELEAVTNYVQTHILNAMSLPAFLRSHDGEHGLALTDLSDMLRSLLSTSTDNAWLTVPFDKIYENPDDGQHSIRTSAVFVFVNGKATINGIEVVQFYAVYCGVYYQVDSPFLAARAALFVTLVDRALQLVPGYNPPAIDSPEVQLRNILEQYAAIEFQKRIGFDYYGTPSDLAPGRYNSVRRVSTLLHLDVSDSPITEATVRARVRRVVENEMFLDAWVEELVVNALAGYVYDVTGDAVLNSYNSNPLQRIFAHTNSQVLSWFTRGIVTYANGQDFDGGRRYKAHIIHLFLVTYPTTFGFNSASLKAASIKEVTLDNSLHCGGDGKFKILAF